MTSTALLSSSSALSRCHCFRTRSTQTARHAARLTVSAASQEVQQQTSRREAMAAVASVAALLSATPAKAFLGIGEQSENDTYLDDTKGILGQVQTFLDLAKDDAGREEKVLQLRNSINSWVAKYRRKGGFSGRPSFGNTYTVLNALAGHFNSFGNTAPLPKKRLERIVKELADANRLLARNR